MKWCISLCVFLLLPALGIAETDTAATLREFDAYLNKTSQQLGDSPFAAVVSKDGEIIYERYHDGHGVLEKTVNEDSRWQIYSITKSFVSALVLGLCEDLLGHRSGRITTHYSAAELSKLLEAANRVCDRKGKQPELVVLRRLNVS
jgi:CubicO group peptidase (beta-lactamase class C family)